MVAGHAGAPFQGFIYLFHMALFFIASGYCQKEKHTESGRALLRYYLSKIRSLYVPFVTMNVFLALVNNPLVRLGLLDADMLLTGREILFYIVKSLFLLRGVYYFTVMLWFIRVLFVICIASATFEFLIRRFKCRKYIRFGLYLVVAALSQAICITGRLQKLQPLLLGYLAFAMGARMRRYHAGRDRSGHTPGYAVAFAASFVAICLLTRVGCISLGGGKVPNVVFFYVCSLLGWIMCYSLGKLLRGVPAAALAFIGRHSMSVLLWHLFAFKAVTAVRAAVLGDYSLLAPVFPEINDPPMLWLAYTVVGTALPVLVAWGIDTAKKRLRALSNKTRS